MYKHKTQKWHEPEQEQFWRYVKDNKILETLQPALTLLYELPVKPNDLYSFFAEYLENGAKSAIQLSLLRAELCFKQNELEEAKSLKEGEAEILDLRNTNQPTTARTDKPLESELNEPTMTPSIFSVKSSSIQFPRMYNNNQEMDQVMDFIEEYHDVDPFGILFDFHLHESETYEASAEHEQKLSQLRQSVLEKNSPNQFEVQKRRKSYPVSSFFDLNLAQSTDHLEMKRQFSPMEKLVAGLRKFEEEQKGKMRLESFDSENDGDEFNEGKNFNVERSFLEDTIGHEISVDNPTRKKLLRVFDVKDDVMSKAKREKKNRKAYLKKMVKKYLKKLKRQYGPRSQSEHEASGNHYYNIEVNKQIHQREKHQRALGFRGSIPVEDDDDADFLNSTEFDKTTGKFKNGRKLKTKPDFVYDFPLEDVLKAQEWIDEYFPESVWKLNEPLDPNSAEASDDYDDDGDENYIWLEDLKKSCEGRIARRGEGSDTNLALPSAILENLHKGALKKIRRSRLHRRQANKLKKHFETAELLHPPLIVETEETEICFRNQKFPAIIEESSLPKPKKVLSVPSLLKIPAGTEQNKSPVGIRRGEKRSEQAKAYVDEIFSEKYKGQLLFPFEMLDDD